MTKWDNANRLAFSDNLDDRFEREHRKRNYALMACENNDAIHTVGHSTRTIEVFIDLLRNHTIELLIDVRRWPASRRHPHFHRDRLAVSLGDSGVYYLWRGDLGGFRKPSEISPNTAWRVGAFRAYADFMLTPEFQTIMSEVEASAKERRAAIMCAEAVPWRCHRQLLADAFLVRGWKVRHILDDACHEHKLPDFATVDGLQIIYRF
jgi:uncharacterized protein (DUF488 family)